MLLVTNALYSSGGTFIFSTFYLKSGFWQIEMTPNSREKTASATHKDVNSFLTMHFGFLFGLKRVLKRVLAPLVLVLRWHKFKLERKQRKLEE